ncbi:hypothetical protein R1flu_011191 [Riccia fluitans]|uniref:Secreted protein n=1 Tax=Riccia fluitans TaxID=41844 RepID=A0ABD1Z744_9MARC
MWLAKSTSAPSSLCFFGLSKISFADGEGWGGSCRVKAAVEGPSVPLGFLRLFEFIYPYFQEIQGWSFSSVTTTIIPLVFRQSVRRL